MRAAPDIERVRRNSLRPSYLKQPTLADRNGPSAHLIQTYSVNESSRDVQYTLQEHPAESHPRIEFVEAVNGQSMDNGNDAGDTEPDEHEGAVGAPGWGAEVFEPGNYEASQAKSEYLVFQVSSYVVSRSFKGRHE